MRHAIAVLSIGAAAILFTLIWPPRSSVAAVAAATCPSPPVTAAEIIGLYDASGPLERAYPPGVPSFSEQARACFESRLLTFRAFVPPYPGLGVGGTQAYAIEPRWMGGGAMVTPTERPTDPVRFLVIAVPPVMGDIEARYGGRWVLVSGRYDSPAAQSCAATGTKGETPDRAEAIEICRSTFVLSRISTVLAPPTTDTSPDPTSSPPAIVLLAVVGVLAAVGSWRVIRRPEHG